MNSKIFHLSLNHKCFHFILFFFLRFFNSISPNVCHSDVFFQRNFGQSTKISNVESLSDLFSSNFLISALAIAVNSLSVGVEHLEVPGVRDPPVCYLDLRPVPWPPLPGLRLRLLSALSLILAVFFLLRIFIWRSSLVLVRACFTFYFLSDFFFMNFPTPPHYFRAFIFLAFSFPSSFIMPDNFFRTS